MRVKNNKLEKSTKKNNLIPVVAFQLTAICESSDSASIQHSIYKKHSLCDGLHQL